jgi:hypothetical protein
MKFSMKKGKVEVTIQYSDYALKEIETASKLLNLPPLEVCALAHRMMIGIAHDEPALFASMVAKFRDGFICNSAN